MHMNIKLQVSKPGELATECLVLFAVDEIDENSDKEGGKNNGNKDKHKGSLKTDDAASIAVVADVIATGELSGKALETLLFYKPQGLKAKRLLVIGGGKSSKFSINDIRKGAGAAVRHLKSKNIRSLAIVVPNESSSFMEQAVRAIVEGALLADFDPDTYKSDRKDQSIQELTVVASQGNEKTLQAKLQEGRIFGESQNFTRTLVNEPSNHLTPTAMAEYAQKMAAETGLHCEILGAEDIKKLKMGAFWSVAQGSDEPPALIVLRYEPAGAPEHPTLGLIGKGVTFDTGGISIKPADGMEKMKYDMAGGAAMIGAMRAIALLKPKVKVISIICATENMPSGKAQKPGDVQIAMSGKSIEIINTDAEGRLVLADGLAYAKKLGCTHLIDAATLTGACVVALGTVNAGLFANDEDIYAHFTKGMVHSGEKFWRLPLDEEYREMIRSNIADIVNSGGRYGGAVTAAMFLKEFAEDTPWIHLDIAGVAWLEENKPWMAKGPSGAAVRSLVEFVREYATGKN